MESILSMYAMPAYAFGALLMIARAATGTWSSPAVFVSATYLLSGLATLLFDPYSLQAFAFNHETSSVIGYVALTLIGIAPAFAIRRPEPVDLFANPLMGALLRALALMAWYSFLYQFPFALKSLTQGAEVTREILNVEKVSPLPISYFTTVAVGVSMFYPIYILAFLDGIARKRSIMFQLSCLVGVLAGLANGICFTARDVFIWIALTFVYAYWVYAELIGREARSIIKVFLTFTFTASAAGLVYFTLQRFGYRDPLNSVLSYLGQQPYVFAETVAEQRHFYGLSLKFPVIAEVLGVMDETRRTVSYEWTFGGFAKDFYAVAGWRVAFVMSGTLALGTWLGVVLTRRQHTPAHLLICYLYLQFIVQGMFFYRLGSPSGNQYHILMFLLIAGLQLMSSPSAPGPRRPARP